MKTVAILLITLMTTPLFAAPMCFNFMNTIKPTEDVKLCKPRGGLCFSDIDCCLGLRCGSVKRCD